MNLVDFFASGDSRHPMPRGFKPAPVTTRVTWSAKLSAQVEAVCILEHKAKTKSARITLAIGDQQVAQLRLSGVELSEANWWLDQLKLILHGEEVKL